MSGDDLLFEMVQALTRLLQASLHTKKMIFKITVAQELEYINAYLYIQKGPLWKQAGIRRLYGIAGNSDSPDPTALYPAAGRKRCGSWNRALIRYRPY